MMALLACGTGFILDFLFGDPVWLYHPIRLIGALIAFLEKQFRRICKDQKNAQFVAGGLLWILVVLVSVVVPLLWTGGFDPWPGAVG